VLDLSFLGAPYPSTDPIAAPQIKEGLIDPKDLPVLARKAHASSGLTQSQAATKLDTTQQAYSQALSLRKGLNMLRRRIVEAFTHFRVGGPFLKLVKKDKKDTEKP